jgi:hypothetical protein
MIGQDDPRIYSERSFGFCESHRLAQKVNLLNKKIAPAICESHSKEDRDAGKFGATIVGHASSIDHDD